MSDDKTEEPTHQRLMEARKKGQIAKSNDVSVAFVLFSSALFLSTQGKTIFIKLAEFVRYRITSTITSDITADGFRSYFFSVMTPIFTLFAPFVLMVVVAGVVGNIIQTGFLFSMESINPKFDKMNPIEGVKKIFSMKGFMEFLKVIAKTLVLIFIFKGYLQNNTDRILTMGFLSKLAIFENYFLLAKGLFVRIAGALMILAAMDYGYQWYMFKKQMMMTKQEVKEEYKKSEGDPLIKSRIKMKQREFIKKRMLMGVKDSRVVIVNPTHYAVGLRYSEEMDEAPIVSSKGKGYLALQIRKLAEKHNIPIYENPPLARAMFKEVEVDEMIPAEMYRAVAEVIAFVEKLGDYKSGGNHIVS